MRLSENFSLSELTFTNHQVKNIPSECHIINLSMLCQNILEPVRAHFKMPVLISSGFRSAALNKLIHGAPSSQHCLGEAADFSVKTVANVEVWKFIKDNLLFDQVIAELLSKKDGKAGWIHVSHTISRPNRKQALSFLGSGKYVSGLYFAS